MLTPQTVQVGAYGNYRRRSPLTHLIFFFASFTYPIMKNILTKIKGEQNEEHIKKTKRHSSTNGNI